MLRLEQICNNLLIKYKAYLGDIGEMPLILLSHVLHACDSEDLLRIEEDTRSGGRTISSAELAVYWRRVFLEDFGRCGDNPEDWKAAYLAKQCELEEKRARVGRKVRGMWEEEKKRKDLRCIQVIDKIPQSQLRRGKLPVRSPPPLDSSRQRLAKKLRINPLILKSSPFVPRMVKPEVMDGPQQLDEHIISWDAQASRISPVKQSAELRPNSRELQDRGIIAACNAARNVELDWP